MVSSCHPGADTHSVPAWGVWPPWAASATALAALCLVYLVWAIGASVDGPFLTALVAGGLAIVKRRHTGTVQRGRARVQ